MLEGREELLAVPEIPASDHFVMFDLEGLPPYLDDLDRVYLWGMQVFGLERGPYLGVLAGSGPDADRLAWQEFLGRAAALFDEHGEIPFVHWALYERTKLDLYVRRHGDPAGVAARIRRNLLDLLEVTKRSLVLPLPSRSLKVVEKHIGFRRSQRDYGGEWSMARYIEAVETGDEAKRTALLEEIRIYNEEDLQAT